MVQSAFWACQKCKCSQDKKGILPHNAIHFGASCDEKRTMYKPFFCVSDKVLNGYVACAYCNQKNIWKFQNLAHHFKFSCKNICLLNDCDCNICVYQIPLVKINDGVNLYLNRKSAINYFSPSVEQFWGQTEPCFLIRDSDSGDILITHLTPESAA